MIRYLVRQVSQGVVSLFVVTVLVFSIVHITGDPVQALLGITASQEQEQLIREELGLDEPLHVQYVSYMSGVVQGDLGTSVRGRRPVDEVVFSRLPATIQLGLAAIMISVIVGLPLGIYAAYWQGSAFDRGARMFAVFGQSAPQFWLGIVLILLFAVIWQILPAGGTGGWEHLILPAFTMAAIPIAGITRLMRSSLLETLETDYIRLSRVKGLPERTVLWKHGLRNAGLPVLTYTALIGAGLVTGSVVVETVFAWPGLGSLLVDSIAFRDMPVIQASVLILSTIYIVVNMVVDVLYGVLNPRIRRGA